MVLVKLSDVCDPKQPFQVSVRVRHGIGLGQGFEIIETRAEAHRPHAHAAAPGYVGAAFQMYATDYDGAFPSPGGKSFAAAGDIARPIGTTKTSISSSAGSWLS